MLIDIPQGPSMSINIQFYSGFGVSNSQKCTMATEYASLLPKETKEKIFSFCILRLIPLLQFFYVYSVEAIQYNRILLQNSVCLW